MTTYNLNIEKLAEENKVPVSGSNRHIHVSQADLEVLFGPGYQLKKMKDLSQPGQFAAQECVTIVGPKAKKEGVRILGPVRPQTQIELMATDCCHMGFETVVRNSGDTPETPGATIIGPAGTVTIKEGVIVAARHLHLHTSEAQKFGFKDKDKVSAKTFGDRTLTFHGVLIRVHDEYALDMHLDLDEMNAAHLKNGDLVQLIR